MLETEKNDIGLWERRSGEDWRRPVMRQRRTAANRKTHTETEKH